MRDFRLRSDLKRAVVDGFALPLGIDPSSDAARFSVPVQGYTVTYTAGQDDEPDTYAYHIVVSHERLAPIIRKAFEMLPDEIYAIVEIGSRDAYRSTDVYIGQELIPTDHFLKVWKAFEPILLEDSSIAAGANSEEPFIEVFIDQWKGLSLHVPLHMQDAVEHMLKGFALEEVVQTWPAVENEEFSEGSLVRPVLEIVDEYSPDVDELLLTLRHEWRLELNIDPESNIDEGGRRLGSTLWHAVVIVEETTPNGELKSSSSGNPGNGDDSAQPRGAYASIWATASSMSEMERLISQALDGHPQWAFGEIYTIDRVAFDERPDELGELAPGRRSAQVHLLTFEPWDEPPPPAKPPDSARGSGGEVDRD